MSNRRFLMLLIVAVGFVSLMSIFFRRQNSNAAFSSTPFHPVNVDSHILKGDAIMGKIGNETLKLEHSRSLLGSNILIKFQSTRAELGRAAWKLFHTTMAKFPDHPTEDEKTALFSYIHLFARLYPW